MERDPVLRLSGVGRRYGLRGPWVLRGVDLGIRAGALIRVQGGNGTGKSTLLRLLAGVDAPSEGRLTQRPRTAFVPERFPAALPFTAVGYLTHLARVHGLARGAAGRSAERWLERFGAGGHARTPLSELSKGGSQKVAVAQALLAEPALLVRDEASGPYTHLKKKKKKKKKKKQHRHTTLHPTTHQLHHTPQQTHKHTTQTITS
ncbi:ABC transporter ATP-binding protein, partial [Streptomyces alfalfae]